MKSSTSEDIRLVYSILPDAGLDLAVHETLQWLETDDLGKWGHLLRWVEFNQSQKVLCTGITDMVGQRTMIVSTPREDENLSKIIDEVEANGLEVGRIVFFPNDNQFIWFLPTASSGADALSEWHVRAFIVTEAFFVDVVRHFNQGRQITAAESRVAFQLVAGASPREAADHDALNVDTKRKQIKSITAKLDCAGQTDLVRMLIGQLSHITAISNSQFDTNDDSEEFITRHLASEVNVGMHRLRNGRVLRVLECGQSDATPIVVLHGLLFPNLIYGAVRHLKRNNLKLIIPLRRGYLEKIDNKVSDNVALEAIEDIALYIDKNFSTPPLVLGNSYGAPIALTFAAQYPEHVKALLLLSPHFGDAPYSNDSYASHFFGGMRRVIHESAVAEAIAYQFAKHYVKPSRARKILKRLFQDNKNDLSVLEGHCNCPPSYNWFVDLYQRSLTGVADDFRFALQKNNPELWCAKCDVSFLHAAGDPLSSMETVKKVSETLGGELLHAPGEAGHFAATSHSEEVWSMVGEWVATSTKSN